MSGRDSRQLPVAGVTPHPHVQWMMQVARHSTMEAWGCLSVGQSLLHDREGPYGPVWQQRIAAAGVTRGPTAAAVAALQRLCGTLGTVGHGGMSRAVDPLWGNVAPPCAGAGGGAWSPREASSGQAPCPALACGQPRDRAPTPDGVARTVWGTPARRHARSRLRFLTLRGDDGTCRGCAAVRQWFTKTSKESSPP